MGLFADAVWTFVDLESWVMLYSTKGYNILLKYRYYPLIFSNRGGVVDI